VMKIEVAVFWVVTPCSDVVGYECFGVAFSLHLHGEIIVMWYDTNVSEVVAASIFTLATRIFNASRSCDQRTDLPPETLDLRSMLS
jgi:hypothetical protein